MARTMKKTTATKAETAPVVEETVKEEVVKKQPVAKAKRKFAEDDGILCRSVTPGKLIMIGNKTGMKYIWNDYGHEYEIEYRDLVIAVRTRSKFVFGPMFIIEDEDFINEFDLVKKFYANSYNTADLQEILGLPVEEMEKAITALPPEAKKSFKTVASTAVREGSLDSLAKIKVLDEIFGIQLKLLAEMD